VSSGRYRDLNSFLRERFGCRVQKIPLDAGMTCPNRDGTKGAGGCIYCGDRGSGTGAYQSTPDIRRQMERGMEWSAKRYKAKKFIAYFQSFTNTHGPVDKLERLYRQALISDDVVGLSVGTRPDCVSGEALDLLQELAKERMVWVEYGLQSSHDVTLALINRGHGYAEFAEAVERTANRGILICAHVILGLPGENRSHMIQTAGRISELELDGLKIHLLYVLKNTPLEDMHRGGGFRCLEMDEYADLVVDFLERMHPSLVIQRLTGDPNPLSDLVAPLWAADKRRTLDLIEQRFTERDAWQGKLFSGVRNTANMV
jgi:radical SAM protein (TIGR01212 family)